MALVLIRRMDITTEDTESTEEKPGNEERQRKNHNRRKINR